jgi:CRP/FNR family transcriptional regulator, cyclic AMP receptor protein
MGLTQLIQGLPGSSPALRELATRGTRHSYKKGRLLIEEGDGGDAIYIVLSGALRVYSADVHSGREITFGTYGPGEYVGEMSLDGGLRSANVEALQTTECVLIARQTLQVFITQRPEFAFELLAKVIRRARAATLSMRQLALNDVYGRLRLQLESLAMSPPAGQAHTQAGGEQRWVRPKPTHRDLSQVIGCSREMVSRLMKDLERGGHITSLDDAYCLHGVLPMRW